MDLMVFTVTVNVLVIKSCFVYLYNFRDDDNYCHTNYLCTDYINFFSSFYLEYCLFLNKILLTHVKNLYS